ncbi:MAG: hypothetical protein EBY25_00375 [Betaproteobacteria bacterium]|nr:hypothetical protein [Betaproteobacteria bacterium]
MNIVFGKVAQLLFHGALIGLGGIPLSAVAQVPSSTKAPIKSNLPLRPSAVDVGRVEIPKAADVQAATVGVQVKVTPAELKSEEGRSIGPLAFSVEYPFDWVEDSAAFQRAKMLLTADGNSADPAFAFQKRAQGGIIYGTWISWPEGNKFISAQVVESMGNPIPATWGIEPGNIKSKLIKGEYLEASHLEVTGKGDGTKFFPGGGQATVAIWAQVPLTFRRGGRTERGTAKVAYIGSESDDAEGKLVLESILRKIKPNGVEQVTEQAFLAQLKPPSGNNAALPAATNSGARAVAETEKNALNALIKTFADGLRVLADKIEKP